MGHVNPDPLPDALHLEVEQGRVYKNAAIDAAQPVAFVP
jgi:hypothetical protein